MSSRRFILTVLCILAIAALMAGCGGDDDTTTNADTTASTATSAPPAQTSPAVSDPTVGLIAIGHSALTGESSDDNRPLGDVAPANSWATGTNPEVNSIYSRLIVALPETEGHVSNKAEGGASAYRLINQADQALKVVPNPALVIIQTIDNDIMCDGTDAEHVKAFGISVDATLKKITEASPQSKIIIVTQPGRPERGDALAATDPSFKASRTGSDICAAFNPAGERVPEGTTTLTGIIEMYEAEQARVCANYPQCNTDNGAFKNALVDDLSNFAPDHNHFNKHGLSLLAAALWPVVEQVFGLTP